jgi:hypothetical protein
MANPARTRDVGDVDHDMPDEQEVVDGTVNGAVDGVGGGSADDEARGGRGNLVLRDQPKSDLGCDRGEAHVTRGAGH